MLWVVRLETAFAESVLSYASFSEGLEAFGLCHAGDVLFMRFLIHFLSRRIFIF